VELGLLGVEQRGMRAVAVEELPVAPPKGVQTTKDSITIGASQEPADLTMFNNASINARIRSLIDDGLVGRDDNGNLFPLDAWYVPTLENGGARFLGQGEDRYLQVKYKIRPGIKWSDGVELTSKDAVFAYKLLMNPNAPVVSRYEQQRLQNVDNPDRYTVIYNYRSFKQVSEYYTKIPDKENYPFLKLFVDSGKPVVSRSYAEIGVIMPEHALALIPPEKIQESAFARNPVGTGPWKVESWVQGVDIMLVPNEHYSLTAKPAIKRIEIRFVTDVARLTEQIRTGNLDMVTSEAFVLPPPGASALKAAGISIASRPGERAEILLLNYAYGPFKEKAVREAIFSAINRKRINDEVFSGTGGVSQSLVSPGVYYSIERKDFASLFPDIAATHKLPAYPYDPERASKLLDEAGWNYGQDGIRVKNGQKLQFDYMSTINAMRQKTQMLVQADLRAVGIDAVVKSYPAVVCGWYPETNCPWFNGETKLLHFSWASGSDRDFDWWTCAELYDRQWNRGINEQSYCNPALDNANVRFKSEATLETQVAAAAEIQVILMQDIPVIPLVHRPNIELVSDKLANFKLTNTTTSSFWNARQWYFR
jgi:peptide/nickel transport system substrate-binding protein